MRNYINKIENLFENRHRLNGIDSINGIDNLNGIDSMDGIEGIDLNMDGMDDMNNIEEFLTDDWESKLNHYIDLSQSQKLYGFFSSLFRSFHR